MFNLIVQLEIMVNLCIAVFLVAGNACIVLNICQEKTDWVSCEYKHLIHP
jgi:hypothetical protein